MDVLLRLERRSREVPCLAKGLPGLCWVTVRGRNRQGYSQTSWNGRTVGAHRASWSVLRGDIPEGLEPDHLCRNRACWNPWHLDLVTHRVNLIRGHTGRRAGDRCPSGHEYDKVTAKGYPLCSLCSRLAGIRFRARKRQKI